MHGNQCAAGTARKPVRTAADNGADHSTDSANRGAERRRHADNDENKKTDQQQYISERNADPVFKEADSGFSGGEEKEQAEIDVKWRKTENTKNASLRDAFFVYRTLERKSMVR